MHYGNNQGITVHCCVLCFVLIKVASGEYEWTGTTARAAYRMDTAVSKEILSTVDNLKSPDELLDVITNLTNGVFQCYREVPVPVKFNVTQYFPDLIKAATWVSAFLVDYIQTSGQNFETPLDKGYKFLHRSITNLFEYEPHLSYMAVKLPPTQEEQTKILVLHRSDKPEATIRHTTSTLPSGGMEPESYEALIASNFHVYYSCPTEKWLAKLSFPLNSSVVSGVESKSKSVSSVMVLAVDITEWDIYQCEKPHLDDEALRTRQLIDQFAGSANCHEDTNDCIFHPGSGWTKGSYSCRCKERFYLLPGLDRPTAPLSNATSSITGKFDEEPALEKREVRGGPADCALCYEDCDTCWNGLPCYYVYNRVLRILLLSITSLCIVATLVLSVFIHKYRRVKVIRVASPKFLCITLLGAAVMYSETIAIFFEDRPNSYICMGIEWTRHLGFLITYSSLFMKTWRISGLFRIKSAHKIKLTDKQLLQWMCPLLLIMVIYLATWSAGAPATPEILKDENGLRYFQCAYGWWDHCLVAGNVIFLLWGIRVCYRVRKAESYFNEAKYISFAIYNIAGVNAVFLLLHLVVYPQASPDIKFVFAFLRIQFSTTVTICLVFGPKVFAIIRGQGENFEFRDRPGAQIPLNSNGGPVSQDEVIDVYQENEDLKDEIQKLASQIEWMKIVHMNIGNRHLKFKHSTAHYHIASSYFPPSPILRSLRRRSSDAAEVHTIARMSPAAELVSERV